MHDLITIENAFSLKDVVFVDTRSEGEYAEDHIPGAISIPIFNNEERAAIGTVYKQEGQENAKILGLKLAGPNLHKIYEQFSHIKSRNIVIYCWRGGMRSKFVFAFLQSLGKKVFRLQGGYKSYRRFVNGFFQNPPNFEAVVLHGLTGVGKTELLKVMPELHLNAVDLEGFANNRGSVFGNVALSGQPTQKFFESLLFDQLFKLKNEKYFLVECESKRIGKVFIPDSIFEKMHAGKHILVFDSIKNRIQRIIKDYRMLSGDEKIYQELIDSTLNLKQKLGAKVVDQLVNNIKSKDFECFVEFLLTKYYDPLYKYPDQPSPEYDLSVDAREPYSACLDIQKYLQNIYEAVEVHQ